MKVIRKGKGEPFDDMFPGTYEFKLCGGSVEPGDRVEPAGSVLSDEHVNAADGEPAPLRETNDLSDEGGDAGGKGR